MSFFHRHYHRHYHGIYHNPKKLFILDLCLLAAALLMFAASLVFWFWKPGITDLIDVEISLGDTRLKSGDYAHLTINYTNRSRHHLTRPTLAVRLPSGFVVDRTQTPLTLFSKNSTFTLDDLDPGASGQVGLFGQFWAEPGKETKIIAILSYQVETDTNREQKLGTYLATLPESILLTSLEAPASAFPNVAVPFSLKIKNNSAVPVSGITVLEHGLKATFKTTTSLKNISLSAGEELSLNGTFLSPQVAGVQTAAFVTEVLPNNQPIIQSSKETRFTVVTPSLNITARNVNAFDYLEPGQTIPLEISWKNSTPFPLKTIRLRLASTPGFLNLRATAKANNLKIEGTDLIIDSSVRTALAAETGTSDQFALNLVFNPIFSPIGQTTREFHLTPIIEARSDQVSDQVFTMNGDDLVLPLATDLTLKAETRFYTPDGDQLGRGPLPPRVGATTKYWIFIEAFNTVNPIEDAFLSLTLPNGVTPTAMQSVTLGAPLSWEATARSLTWSMLDIPAQSKTGWYFQVAVTPTLADIGQTISLVKNLTFVAKDKKVHKPFNLRVAELSNVLKSDDRGSKSGAKVVVQ